MKAKGTKSIFNIAALLILLCMTVFSNGCASIFTATFPPVSKVKKGRVVSGEPEGYKYNVQKVRENIFEVKKTPMCPELIERYRVEKKQLRGVWLAALYIPVLGLGYYDWVYADGIAKSSKKVTKIGEVSTGVRRECGNQTLASNEEMIVQIPSLAAYETISTNEKGKVDMSPVTREYRNFISLNLFAVKEEGLKYATTLYVQ